MGHYYIMVTHSDIMVTYFSCRPLDCGVKVIAAHCATEVCVCVWVGGRGVLCGWCGCVKYNHVHACIHRTLYLCMYISETSSLQNKMHGISCSTCYISPMSFSTYIHSLQGHAPDSDNDGALVSCFDLFLRLMREDK